MARKLIKPLQGDLVLVLWRDITGHATGELANATTTLSATPGFYVGYRGKGRTRELIITPTVHIHPRWDGSAGWDAYPAGVIHSVIVLAPKAEVMERYATT